MKFASRRERNLLEKFKFCKAEEVHIWSEMSETKAAFAERTTRSLKTILYRYKEGFRYKYTQKHSPFVIALISRKNSSKVS